MIIIYTTGCAKCKVLESKLVAKNIKYSIVTDIDLMLSKGLNFLPVLEVNGQLLDFASAIEWVNKQ